MANESISAQGPTPFNALEESARSLQSTLTELQPPLTATVQLVERLPLREQVGQIRQLLGRTHSVGSSSNAPASNMADVDDTDETDDTDAALQALLEGTLKQVQAVERQLDAAQRSLGIVMEYCQQGLRLARSWEAAKEAQLSRLRNEDGRAPLVSLPLGVLGTIARKAGKEARLVCKALCSAHGPPGAGLLLPCHILPRWWAAFAVKNRNCDDDLPGRCRLDNSLLAAAPRAKSITRLHCSMLLAPYTCELIAHLLPNLRAVSLPAGASYSKLPAGITRLHMATWGVGELDSIAHMTSLQSLWVAFFQRHGGQPDLGPLARLTRLTSLTLASATSRRALVERGWREGCDDNDDEDEEEELEQGDGYETQDTIYSTEDERRRRMRDLGMWGVLSKLPGLARLRVEVEVDYQSDLQQAGELTALTHLELLCMKGMVQRDERRGVEAPLLQVLALLPVLVSLKLRGVKVLYGQWSRSDDLDYRELLTRPQELVVQALQHFPLLHLELADSVDPLASPPPTLLTYRCDSSVPLTPRHIDKLFPLQCVIQTLELQGGRRPCYDDADSLAGAVSLLAQRLPQLTRLQLESYYFQESEEQAVLTPPDLSLLANLQQLRISGGDIVAQLLPSLPSLLALTRLELPHALPGAQAGALGQLGHLRHLQLGGQGSHLYVYDEQALKQCMVAVRGMAVLSELVLGEDVAWRRAVLEQLLPVPPALRRVVVCSEGNREQALQILGGCVDEICVAGCGLLEGEA